MTTDYDKEIDPAKELFWRNMMAAANGTTTKTKILVKLEELSFLVKKSSNRGRGLLNAISHGFGVFKSEADKLFRD